MRETQGSESPTGELYGNEWSRFTRRVIALVLAALSLVAIAIYSQLFSSILLAAAVAALNLIPALWLTRKTRLGYSQSVGVTYLIYLVIGITLVLLLLIPAFELLAVFLQDLGEFADQLGDSLRERDTVSDSGIEHTLLTLTLDVLDRIESLFDTTTEAVLTRVLVFAVGGIASTLNSALNLILEALFIHILALFILLELPSIADWIVRSFDQHTRREFTILGQRMVQVVGNYLRSASLSILISAVAASLMLLILGVPHAIFIAFLASVFIMIPVIGGYMGGFLVMLGAAIGGSTLLNFEPQLLDGLATWAIYTVLQGFFISNFVEPRLYSKALAISIVILLPTLVMAGAALGLFGMLLVVPTLGFIKEALTYLLRKLKGGDPYPDEPPSVELVDRFLLATGHLASPESAAPSAGGKDTGDVRTEDDVN